MRRRDFIALAGTAAAFPRVALAQQAAKVPRVAFLTAATMPAEYLPALQAALMEFGLIDGKNVAVELFAAPTNVSSAAEILPFAALAVASKPDVILTWGLIPAQAARQLTGTIPIVFTTPVADPVDSGLIASWAHPGGNVTGNTMLAPDSVGKQIGILKETIPNLRRLALLDIPSNVATHPNVEKAASTAAALGIDPVVVAFVEQQQDIAAQFVRVLAVAPDALYVPASGYFGAYRDTLFDLLRSNRLPAMSTGTITGAATPFIGVVSYGPSALGVLRRSAYYIDAILRGAKPGDLPVEQPREFDFAVNRDTARRLGITIPQSILAQATIVVDEDWRAPKAVAK